MVFERGSSQAMSAGRRTMGLLATGLVVSALITPSPVGARQKSVRLYVDDRAIEVLGLTWGDTVSTGKFDSRDPVRDESLRRVTLAIPAQARSVFVTPELGKKVTLSFVEGDPDRPLVLGLLGAKDDEPAPGGTDSDGNRWVKIRITFREVTRSKSPPAPPDHATPTPTGRPS
jgi:hypothetical protein